MHPARRTWLKISLAGLLVAGGIAPFWRRIRIRLRPITDTERHATARMVDLMVPRDESPGAVDLGVHLAILARIETSRWDGQRLAEACMWLDRQARAAHGRDFLGLDEPLQVALMETLEAEPRESDPARAFRALRHETMSLFYARPESWPGLGIDNPPQPAGYPDYADMPRARST